jgi:hypothetical protein
MHKLTFLRAEHGIGRIRELPQPRTEKSTPIGVLCRRVFANGEDTLALRLASELADLRAVYADLRSVQSTE